MGPALTTTSSDAPVPNAVQPPTEPPKIDEEGTNQKTGGDVEGRRKKKTAMQGRGTGIGAVPKNRGSSWTGAGFD